MSEPGDRNQGVSQRLKLILPLVVLLASAVIAYLVMTSKPTAKRSKPAERQARLVQTATARAAPKTMLLSAHGSVQAADSTSLRARVSGQIVALTDKLAPGTRFDAGDILARIDPADYKLALENARTDLASAKASLRVEQGQQAVARRELALVDAQVSADERDLALRGPQLEQARAEVDAARTAVEQARLDLDRTRVRAPFDGIVTNRDASVGDVVSLSDTLATLAATEAYWVDVSMPVDQLRWLHAASPEQPGSAARIRYPEAWGDDTTVAAEVLRIQPGLETQGRMARVLLRVPNPLKQLSSEPGPSEPGLLLGAYVEARIEAHIPDDSVAIDAAYLHENNTLWVMTDAATLDIRSVDVVYRDTNKAIIAAGLRPGEAIVTSDLTAPIQNMPLRVDGDSKQAAVATARDDDGANNMATARGDSAQPAGTVVRQLRLTPRPRTDNTAAGQPRS